jgi:steroid delta-isomerase-like uncharacterized protein
MSIDATRLVTHQLIQEVWNRGNLSLMDELCAADCTFLGLCPADDYAETLDSTKAWIYDLRQAFPDLHVSICGEVAASNMIALKYTAHGTFARTLCGIEANHKSLSWRNIMIMHVDHVKICGVSMMPDRQTLLRWLSRPG